MTDITDYNRNKNREKIPECKKIELNFKRI